MKRSSLFLTPWICILFLFSGIMRVTGSLPFSLAASCLLFGAGWLADRLLRR